ncbi:MAG: DEAD/DEAH box helicase family protein, partial [Thermoguttaceae bacterium]|nr:DEAD/DEAH box helicase family protein [Thermoguttaceae bacterium]
SRDEAVASLSYLFAFVFQLDYRYGEKFKPRKFDPAAINATSAKASVSVPSKFWLDVKKELESLTADNQKKTVELEKLREKFAAQCDQKDATIAQKEAELLELARSLGEKNATVDALQQELEAFKTQREQELALVVAPDPNEAETRRRYVDVELKLSGWVFPDEKAETGVEPNVEIEFEIDGLPTPSGKGRADYVLKGKDGKPFAVVEAKRALGDPEAGREQAKLYADALEKSSGVRPLIFYSNGFKTWLWDDSNSPPRRVGGFYSPKDLEKVVERRGVVKSLVETEVRPSFGLRPYQKGAVRAVCEAFESGKRRALVAMATGTGKTRTVAALVDVMTRANRVQRTLFLADRRELVSQAKDSFNATCSDLTLCNFLDNKADAATARVLFSTYPTLLNALDSARNAGDAATCALTPGAFDLIVVDEAHRSVYRKYRAIFEYFDALVVGLTATPKDEVDRNTFKFFDVEQGTPTFAYSYEEAVEAGFLVPYRNVEITTKILERGIVYDDLTDEEKECYEELFGNGE